MLTVPSLLWRPEACCRQIEASISVHVLDGLQHKKTKTKLFLLLAAIIEFSSTKNYVMSR